MMKYLIVSFIMVSLFYSCKTVEAPQPYGPCPNENQMKWQEMEYYAFIHFSMNSYTDIEWGYGDADPSLFNPSDLDCEQWVRICKEGGMKGIIITAKHHDGFCLWPTATTDYSVKRAPWRDGKGDLVGELAAACRKHGLKFGVYLSPWDRNHALYGKPEYIAVFREQLRELLTNYGDVFEVWFDGANGGTGYYGGAREDRSVDRRTYYDWPGTYQLVRELQPNAMIFGDGGPDVRWCGNEEGWVGETNWSLLRRDEVWPGWPHYEQLRYGHEDGTHWVPAEVNVSTRPGWFYHQSEDHKVKTLPQLLDIYYHSIGRNATLLINFPVDKRGMIHENDGRQIVELARTVSRDFAYDLAAGKKAVATNVRGNARRFSAEAVTDGDKETYWATDDSVRTASLVLELDGEQEFNRFLVQEYIPLGQRVKAFSVEALVGGEWKLIDSQTTIGYKRILRFPAVKASKVRFTVTDAAACPLINNIELYNAPKVLTAPLISRNKAGEVTVTVPDRGVEVFYTTDGTIPSDSSARYDAPFMTDGKTCVHAVAVDLSSGEKSPVAVEHFDVIRKDWKILDVYDNQIDAIFDGNPATSWIRRDVKMPFDLVVDLGREHRLKGFRYLPDQNRWAAGIIFNYEFYVSSDRNTWKKVDAGEFSNIKNNPLWQTRNFDPVAVRYIKLRTLNNTDGNNMSGYAELDVITE